MLSSLKIPANASARSEKVRTANPQASFVSSGAEITETGIPSSSATSSAHMTWVLDSKRNIWVPPPSASFNPPSSAFSITTPRTSEDPWATHVTGFRGLGSRKVQLQVDLVRRAPTGSQEPGPGIHLSGRKPFEDRPPLRNGEKESRDVYRFQGCQLGRPSFSF